MADEDAQNFLVSNPLGDFLLDGPHYHVELVGRFEMDDVGHIRGSGDEDALHERGFFVKRLDQLVLGGLFR